MGFTSFILGIIIASCLIIFAEDIQNVMVSTGLRDYLVEWLQSWSESQKILETNVTQ
tara:strand:- start:469 stop:639 length:171 start_codon:yes stop_codon:yes gene_type:complete